MKKVLLAIVVLLLLCCGISLAIPSSKNDSNTTAPKINTVKVSTPATVISIPTHTPTVPPTPTHPTTPIATVTNAPTPTSPPQVTNNIETNINVRSGPDTTYSVIGKLKPGQSANIIGRNSTGTWWKIKTTDGIGWVTSSVVDVTGTTASLPVEQIVASPTATHTTTPTKPQPTATPIPIANPVVIVSVDKRAEYVDIKNRGTTVINLSGWMLRSERGSQDCWLNGTIQPGATLRIWALAADAGREGYNCGFGRNIWNNSKSDPAVLFDPSGKEVSRW